MAIRHREGRKKPWEVYWNNPFTLKRESLYVETEEEAKKQDALKKYQLRYERDLFRKEESGEPKIRHTIESAYYLYLKEKSFKKKWLRAHICTMKRVLRVFPGIPLHELSAGDLKTLKEHLMRSGLKGTTIKKTFSVLRAVLQWSVDEKMMEVVPPFPTLPKADYEKFVPPTQEELAAMLPNAPEHVRRVILLGAQCGMRVGPSELFRLQWKHVDIQNQVIHVPSAEKNVHEQWRDVPIRNDLLPLMLRWLKDDSEKSVEWVIHFAGRPVESIKRAWEATLRRAGITRKIRPYDLRHAFATEALAAGVDIGTVAKLMGHRSPTMILEHYQYVMNRQKRAAVESLPSIRHVAETMWQPGTSPDTFQ